MPRAWARRFTGLQSDATRGRRAGRAGSGRERPHGLPPGAAPAPVRQTRACRRRRGAGMEVRLSCAAVSRASRTRCFELRQVLDEHLAFQVIHLVLNADGEQALRLQRKGIAVLVVRPHLDSLGARDQLVDAGQRKAALLDVGHPDHSTISGLTSARESRRSDTSTTMTCLWIST